jgi:acyl-coenzyme A thioesterase PaaI-like protein
MESSKALQDIYAPKSVCYGCGPANDHGLHVKSRVEGDEVVADWTPEPHHLAYDGAVNGGIIGTLLDCHCNWTGAYHLMMASGTGKMPCTVTAEYTIKLLRPTPLAGPLHLRAHVVEASERKAIVEGVLEAGGESCATCRGVFVAVKEGHPAFHRW